MPTENARLTSLLLRIPTPAEASGATTVVDDAGTVVPAYCYRCSGRLWCYNTVPAYIACADPECEAFRVSARCERRHYRFKAAIRPGDSRQRYGSFAHNDELIVAVAHFVATNPGVDPLLEGESH